MAERAKNRMTAAKLSVSVAVAAVLAGIAGRDQSPPPVAYQVTGANQRTVPPRQRSDFRFQKVRLTTANIKDHSLLYRDFRPGQIYSRKAANHHFLSRKMARVFMKWGPANKLFLSKTDAANTYFPKVQAAGLLSKSEAADTYVKRSDAQSQFVGGKGNVLTGTGSSSKGLVGLVDLPGLANVEGNHQVGTPDSVRITNTSGSPLEYSWTGGDGTIPANASTDISLPNTGPTATVQLLLPAVQVATLTVSAIPTQSGADFVAQGIVGPSM